MFSLQKLLIQEKAAQEVKLAIKPFYQNKDITKEEYKEIVRKAVDKVSWSSNLSCTHFTWGRLWGAFLVLVGTAHGCWKGGRGRSKNSFLLSPSTRAFLGFSEQNLVIVWKSWMGIHKYLGSNWKVLGVLKYVLPGMEESGVWGK